MITFSQEPFLSNFEIFPKDSFFWVFVNKYIFSQEVTLSERDFILPDISSNYAYSKRFNPRVTYWINISESITHDPSLRGGSLYFQYIYITIITDGVGIKRWFSELGKFSEFNNFFRNLNIHTEYCEWSRSDNELILEEYERSEKGLSLERIGTFWKRAHLWKNKHVPRIVQFIPKFSPF